tara:strand:+ start:179 stop:460 length:282 start_codon:yes stop_codon:yes gene_type:complete
MSHTTSDDISDLLDHWMNTKKQISELELSLTKYKKLATKIMSKNDTDIINSDDYVLKKRTLTKKTLCKDDVPKEIWEKYSKTSTYPAYYLSKR